MIRKHIFWRIFIYFAVVFVLVLMTVGIIFSNLNTRNIMSVHEDQIKSLAIQVCEKVRTYEDAGDSDGLHTYLAALENFGEMLATDVWILTSDDPEHSMSSDFANVEKDQLDLPEETEKIIKKAYMGKTESYTQFDEIYEKNIIHLAMPIKSSSGHVMGVVLLNAMLDNQDQYLYQSQRIMFISVLAGLFFSFLLSLFFSGQISRPVAKMKGHALSLAEGNYETQLNSKRRDEIGQLAGSLDVLARRLTEARERQENEEQNRRDFFSNVSHELRTPITVIKGYSETLADGMISADKADEYYDRILHECVGMERLVTDLLILSKMQNPEFQLNMEVINVIAVAQDVLRGLRVITEEKKLDVNLSYNDECSLIEGDYDRIRQLFLIILQNAVKYSFENGKISVCIVKEEELITVSISDTGVGIPSDDLEHIFEKFYRSKNHKEKDGSGLGLVVAKNIIERHHGKIYAKSEKEAGSTFVMEFTAVDEPEL